MLKLLTAGFMRDAVSAASGFDGNLCNSLK